MAAHFELNYCVSDLKTDKLVKNCRLRIRVRWYDTDWLEKYFFCLHCQKVFSRTGFYYHKNTFTFTVQQVEEVIADFVTNRERHDNLLKVEFERRFQSGAMRRVTYTQQTPQHTIAFLPRPLPFQPPRPTRPVRPIVRPLSNTPPVLETGQSERDDGEIDVFDEVQDDFPEMFDCFSTDGFSPSRFDAFIRDFFGEVPERIEKKEFDEIQTKKVKIISVLAQHLYIMCTLSKEQIKNITSFWKTMLCFISLENTRFAKRIHVSYSGCVRDARNQYQQIQRRHVEMFRECCYFSLALDTAQFGRENFLSCVARFGFLDKISQEILLFEKISKTTGQELARFLFDRLVEKNVTSKN